ncbi:hypothetical protein CVT26_016025 [Gymnopilus dilepis]|uniref:Uncharacterized protein n=1 Tax=Gymnopilus dilepis TaxID=231916 RepID=A0A409YDU6_9AGAR|nr:hypothetical protein CVT26_016025 [Gymnopilus dilepis]
MHALWVQRNVVIPPPAVAVITLSLQPQIARPARSLTTASLLDLVLGLAHIPILPVASATQSSKCVASACIFRIDIPPHHVQPGFGVHTPGLDLDGEHTQAVGRSLGSGSRFGIDNLKC